MAKKKQHGGARPGAGAKPKGNAATETIKMRVTPDARAKYESAAERAGVSLSEWLRDAADRRL